jgi:RNA polymerase primary sigma factor
MQFKSIDIPKAFQHLSEIEQRVIIQRFGLFNQTKLSLHEIGEKNNLTRERIRQIEAKALRKLRSADAVKDLLNVNDDEIDEG